ncbi:MAG: hypothetical protein ABIE43_04990 [Patescibacteria group bacterium]
METTRAIRETLGYISEHRRSIVVVKIGHQILPKASELGIIQDIQSIQDAGINIVIVHTDPKIGYDNWEAIEHLIKVADITNDEGIDNCLKFGRIPVIYCGKLDSFEIDEMIAGLAIKLKAKKLIFITHQGGVFGQQNTLISEMGVKDIDTLLVESGVVSGGMKIKIQAAQMACLYGVDRVHIISGFNQSALLREMFSSEGIGTMIYSKTPYHDIRSAEPRDLMAISEILKECDIRQSLSYEQIKDEIKNFVVFTVDGHVHGCVHLKEYKKNNLMIISCLSISKGYEKSDIMEKLLRHALEFTAQLKIRRALLEPTKNITWLGIYPWFTRLDFAQPSKETDLPESFSGKNVLVCYL